MFLAPWGCDNLSKTGKSKFLSIGTCKFELNPIKDHYKNIHAGILEKLWGKNVIFGHFGVF